MVVVADTGPLNYLVLIGHIEVLPALYGQVCIPVAVRTELLHPDAPPPVKNWAQHLPTWLAVLESGPLTLEFHRNLDPGEREAITLAHQLGAQLLLTDDALAYSEAKRYGLPGMGTLGVLRQAHRQGMLSIHEALEKLQNTSFRSTPKLLLDLLKGIDA